MSPGPPHGSPHKPTPSGIRYDVFVSYNPADADFVFRWLLPRLQEAGLEVAVDVETFQPGAPILEEMERAVAESQYTLAVVTPAWAMDDWDRFEALLVQSQDPGARFRRLIPLLVAPTPQLPRRIRLLHYVDLTRVDQREAQLARVVQAIRGTARLPELRPEAAVPTAWQRMWELRGLAGIGAGVLAVLVLLLWWMVGQRGPTVMDRPFNIAVAHIAQIQDGRPRGTDLGRLLSGWLFQALENERAVYAEPGSILIWHDSLPRTQKGATLDVIAGATPAERGQAAAELADRIRAHVVIYGTVEGDSPSLLTVEFFVANRMGTESNLTLGRYLLGDPIPLPDDFDPRDALATRVLEERLTERAKGLFWLLLGLQEDMLGNPQAALTLFLQALERVPDWKETGEGKENLYFFIGREYLFLQNFDQAAEFLDMALSRNPHFARAQIARASVDLRQAQLLSPPERMETPFLADALAGYTRALELAQQMDDPMLVAIGQVALANAYQVQAEMLAAVGQPIGALAAYEQSIELIRSALVWLEDSDQYRLLGQTYAYLGASSIQKAQLLEIQGEIGASVAAYREARDAFAACVEQAFQLLQDTLFEEQVLPVCRRYQDVAETTLARLERNPSP